MCESRFWLTAENGQWDKDSNEGSSLGSSKGDPGEAPGLLGDGVAGGRGVSEGPDLLGDAVPGAIERERTSFGEERGVGWRGEVLGEFLYGTWMGGGPAERVVQELLLPGAWARRPLHGRIPRLQIPKISFVYGSVDWMDASAGQKVVDAYSETGEVQRRRRIGFEVERGEVAIVDRAGHQLFVDHPGNFISTLWNVLERPNLVRRGGGTSASST